MKEKTKTNTAQGATPATKKNTATKKPTTKKKITVYVGPFEIALDAKVIRLDWYSDGNILGGSIIGMMPSKMTADEMGAFREWLSKCPFDPEIYNRK